MDAEGALRRTIDKFTPALLARGAARVHETARRLAAPAAADDRLTLEELDGYWDEAKRGAADLTAGRGRSLR